MIYIILANVTIRPAYKADRSVGVAFDVAQYDVVGDIATCRAKVPLGTDPAASVTLPDVGKLLLDFA